MSSFGTKLAKGFIRSAVNQVGRDGGRLVSNSVYGGRNYVPVSKVPPINNPSQPNCNNEIPSVDISSYVNSVPENAIVLDKPFSSGKIIGLLAISFIFSFFGSIGVLIYGITKYFDNTSKVQWYDRVPVYVPDRRYKDGVRYEGMSNVKREMQVKADPITKTLHQKNGVIAMLIGGVFLILWGLIFILAK